jgi:hypothetical protein
VGVPVPVGPGSASLSLDGESEGHLSMVLDTLSSVQRAIRLYGALGFVRRSAYYVSPLPGTVFMELSL